MAKLRDINTRDGTAHFSQGVSGDLMVYCNGCKTCHDPIAEVRDTEHGVCIMVTSQTRRIQLWAFGDRVRMICPRCSKLIEITHEQAGEILKQLATL